MSSSVWEETRVHISSTVSSLGTFVRSAVCFSKLSVQLQPYMVTYTVADSSQGKASAVMSVDLLKKQSKALFMPLV